MKKVQLKVDGMTCSACSSGLEKYLLGKKGVFFADVNLILGMVTIQYEDLSVLELQNYIKEAGFFSPSLSIFVINSMPPEITILPCIKI